MFFALTNIIVCGVLRTNGESDDKLVIDICWDHVEFTRSIDGWKELLVKLVWPLKSKANQANLL